MVVAGLHAQRRRELIQSPSEEERNIMAENRGSPPGYLFCIIAGGTTSRVSACLRMKGRGEGTNVSMEE